MLQQGLCLNPSRDASVMYMYCDAEPTGPGKSIFIVYQVKDDDSYDSFRVVVPKDGAMRVRMTGWQWLQGSAGRTAHGSACIL